MKRDFSLLASQGFDLLVCGGGIYGAWTAYDAALRGLSVAIVEQGDWACATSSSSSKLIHGGLRYLENYDFKLVRKALAERKMLLDMAPHRVWPLRFGVPIYVGSRIGMLRLKAGLMLYDFLAGFPPAPMRYQHFKKASFAKNFPSLDTSGLHGGFSYGDAQTDDARLVLELISGAMEAGAVCVNYCQQVDWVETNGQLSGAKVVDVLAGDTAVISARQIVNTTGQWISDTEHGREWCRLSKGIHLVLPPILGTEALLLTAQSDGRVFFLIPWYGMTLLGTTDSDYHGDPAHVAVTPEETDYLLTEANHYLKSAWTREDIVGSYAGVRVMQRSEESSPSAVSRDWDLKTAENGIHYSVGGKITSAREGAASMVDAACAKLGVGTQCSTSKRSFPWTPQKNYAEWSADMIDQAVKSGIDQESAMWLVRRHGKRSQKVLGKVMADAKLAERIMPSLPFIYADLFFCASEEMVIHLRDLLRRRIPLLILSKLSENDLHRIATMVAPLMGWDEHAMQIEVVACLQ